MSEAGAVFFGLAVVAVLTVLWVRQFQRERQLRAMQGQRIMKSLGEALLRENSAGSGRSVGNLRKPPLFPALVREVPSAHSVELSLALYSPRR
jgi:hypothetical protein